MPQVVYLDSAHEGGETYLELRIAWCMLPPEGGVIMGDDYSKYWPGLVEDIAKFATYLDKMSDKVTTVLSMMKESLGPKRKRLAEIKMERVIIIEAQ